MSAAFLTMEQASLQQGPREFGPFSMGIGVGERVAILGPSGAGKSTLLKLMARELKQASGQIRLQQRHLHHWSLAELSQRRAVLPQSHEVAFGLPSELVISLGRVSRVHDPELDRIVAQAAELACAHHLLGRCMDTLSGGEKARVQMARVFAQLWDVEGGLVLVDEPLAALDPGLQLQLLDAMQAFARGRQHAVVAVLHDVNHALQGFDRLLLVKEGALVGDLRSDVHALPHLEALYGVDFARAEGPDGGVIVAPHRVREGASHSARRAA